MSHSLWNAPESGLKAPTGGENSEGTPTQNLNNPPAGLSPLKVPRAPELETFLKTADKKGHLS